MHEIPKESDKRESAYYSRHGTSWLKRRSTINSVLLVVITISLFTNQFVLSKSREFAGVQSNNFLTKLSVKLNVGTNRGLTGNVGQDAIKLALAQGVPEVYGNELVVDFANVPQSMNIMKDFDPTYGSKKIQLSGDLLKRYINVGTKIACEFCCGATALIQQNGDAACGCAHSQAMRGLAAYLLEKHALEYTDDQILRELARWKGSYFPKAMVDKISKQLVSGQYTPDVAALLLTLKVPQYSADSKSAPLPSEVKLPGQVGGC
ncbi:MAG: hypothetical protein HY981_04435 [Candidatus Magasanikbacteria bacterium]|nr:hypothetical protein [Candidatus Magasanikbacteria bacterium]